MKKAKVGTKKIKQTTLEGIENAIKEGKINELGKFMMEAVPVNILKEIVSNYNSTIKEDDKNNKKIFVRTYVAKDIMQDIAEFQLKIIENAIQLIERGTFDNFNSACIQTAYKLYKMEK